MPQVEPRLDKFFSKLICWGEPCFNMANEPDFVTPYTYVFAGMPWKTQDVITRIEQQTFKATPDGIPGNDDLGATSGVYVWNALGFYPAVPGVGGVVLGTPMFDKATLRLAGGRTLVDHEAGKRHLRAKRLAQWRRLRKLMAPSEQTATRNHPTTLRHGCDAQQAAGQRHCGSPAILPLGEGASTEGADRRKLGGGSAQARAAVVYPCPFS